MIDNNDRCFYSLKTIINKIKLIYLPKKKTTYFLPSDHAFISPTALHLTPPRLESTYEDSSGFRFQILNCAILSARLRLVSMLARMFLVS